MGTISNDLSKFKNSVEPNLGNMNSVSQIFDNYIILNIIL